MEHGSRTKLVTIAVLGVVFASGVLLGYAADSSLLATTPDVASATEAEGGTTEAPSSRSYVYEQLERTAEQDAAIEEIFRYHRRLMNQLHQDFGEAQAQYEASFDALVFETREAIAQVFPPEQRAEYRQLLADSDARREAERASAADRK
jgi:Spy/CpxP family protein refolding chaperone